MSVYLLTFASKFIEIMVRSNMHQNSGFIHCVLAKSHHSIYKAKLQTGIGGGKTEHSCYTKIT